MSRPSKPVVPPSRSVVARLMGVGGQRPDGSPSVKGIATRLGVSPRTVQRYLKEDRLPEKASARVASLEASDARRPRWIAPTDEGPTSRALLGGRRPRLPAVQDVRGSLSTRYSREDGSIDTRRASTELGVSQRTVQRWVKGESRPKIGAQEKLREKVRESVVSSKRGSRLANRGAGVQITAMITISGDKRRRTIGGSSAIKLSGRDMARIHQAYAQGGDRAAEAVLAHAVNRSSYMQQITGRSQGKVASMAISDISEVAFTG